MPSFRQFSSHLLRTVITKDSLSRHFSRITSGVTLQQSLKHVLLDLATFAQDFSLFTLPQFIYWLTSNLHFPQVSKTTARFILDRPRLQTVSKHRVASKANHTDPQHTDKRFQFYLRLNCHGYHAITMSYEESWINQGERGVRGKMLTLGLRFAAAQLLTSIKQQNFKCGRVALPWISCSLCATGAYQSSTAYNNLSFFLQPRHQQYLNSGLRSNLQDTNSNAKQAFHAGDTFEEFLDKFIHYPKPIPIPFPHGQWRSDPRNRSIAVVLPKSRGLHVTQF